MKKILVLIGIVLLCGSSAAFGDEVDQELPGASEQVRTNTREMIRLGANSDEALRMARLMVRSRFQEEHTIRAQEIVMNALKEGQPAEPVMNKAFEGMTKKVQAEKIVQAMEMTRSRYAYAYGTARGITGEDREIRRIGEAVAEGMAAGLTKEDAGRIAEKIRETVRERQRDQSRDQTGALAGESFTAAREMTRRGVPSQIAAEAVSQALEKGYGEREMATLRHTFMEESQQGDPRRIAERYCRAIRSGTSSEGLKAAGRYGEAGSGGSLDGTGSGDGAGSGSQGAGGSSGNGGGSGGSSGGSSGSGSGGSSGGGSGHGGGGSGGGRK